MGKKILFLMLLALIPLVSATVTNVSEVGKEAVIISELDNPALFDFYINSDSIDSVEIYSLASVYILPKEHVNLKDGVTKIEISAYPAQEVRDIGGLYLFEYQIKSDSFGVYKDELPINIVKLKNLLSIGADNINPEDKTAVVWVKNNYDISVSDVSITISSPFFELSKVISLKPLEKLKMIVDIDLSKIPKLVAGPYIVSANLEFKGIKANIKGNLNYLEKEGTSVEETTSGILFRKHVITKRNLGNTAITAKITSSRDILTRLFTSYSVDPSSAIRRGIFVDYTWEKDLGPSSMLSVVSTTNYTFPFVLILLVVAVVFLVNRYSKTHLVLDKRVSYVKTKGGEFALKVNIYVKAKRDIGNVEIVDHIPAMAKLYDKFGRRPDKIDESNRRLIWNLGWLNSGEEKVFSYIIYSKVNVFGRFVLPSAIAMFDCNGEKERILSNKAYFVSDTTSTED